MGIIRGSGHARKAARAKTVIADGCHIRGELTLDGDLHVDGLVEGTVNAVNVSVGKSGQIQGELIAVHVTVSGQLSGKVKCELLELLGTCHVFGEVQCQDLIIEKGAKFIGTTREAFDGLVVDSIVLPSILMPKDGTSEQYSDQNKSN